MDEQIFLGKALEAFYVYENFSRGFRDGEGEDIGWQVYPSIDPVELPR